MHRWSARSLAACRHRLASLLQAPAPQLTGRPRPACPSRWCRHPRSLSRQRLCQRHRLCPYHHARRQRHPQSRTHCSVLIDRSTPRTSRIALRLNERLEPLKISLSLVLDDVELVANLLNKTLRLVLQDQIYPSLSTAYVFESDRARIRGALRGCPGDLAIRHLLQDLRLPLPAYAGDFGNPLQAIITQWA
jgi:hypothetical protein